MSTSITLLYPFSFKGADYATLTFRRPKNRDLETLETRKGGNTAKSIALIADLAGVEPDVIRELDVEDMAQVNAWLEPILDPKGQASQDAGS